MKLVWDIDPVMFRIGFYELRYYGALFTISLFIGLFFFIRKLQTEGFSKKDAEDFFFFGVLGVVAGTRIVHCLFYEPEYYFANPLEILKIWRGGLASHGAVIGLILASITFSKIKKIPLLMITDGIAYGAAVAATLIRLGNFFNSEIVGRVTSVPWAVHFMRYQDKGMYARHPSQLYEALGAFSILIFLFFIERKLEKGSRGIYTGVFLLGYFIFRFLIEFVKEYQILHTFLTMGQWLSIPFAIAGAIIIIKSPYSWKKSS